MIASRKIGGSALAYLDAMGITVWAQRATETVAAAVNDHDLTLKLGPGSGGILLVCAADTEPASKLANDIVRALGCVPVWSWPGNGEGAVKPAAAVAENLFTTVAVFGTELAEQFFSSSVPKSLHAANLVVLPSMPDLEAHAEARRTLWTDLCRSGMVSAN